MVISTIKRADHDFGHNQIRPISLFRIISHVIYRRCPSIDFLSFYSKEAHHNKYRRLNPKKLLMRQILFLLLEKEPYLKHLAKKHFITAIDFKDSNIKYLN